MKISIITVCYNSVLTLQKTIDSVYNQTYKNIEYIIIDGCSTDGTIELIQSNQKFITRWVSEPDNGLYDAINKGIRLSSGKIIGILNSDDVFFSDTVIEEVVSFHSKNNIMASVGNVLQHDKKGNVKRFYSSRNWDPSKLSFGFMPPHPSIFISRNVFDKFGYYNLDFKIGADYELVTRLFLRNNIVWKYSGITTTSMLMGGVSSSGFSSYNTISDEIQKSLRLNGVKFSSLAINLRFFWKFLDFLRRSPVK